MSHDAIIVGGGLSGLSAAVNLSSHGLKVLILEQKAHLGGRTYSFVDKKTGDVVDNGQHLLMGCYRETRHYLRTIGSERLGSLQRALNIRFLRPGYEPAVLSCPSLPAPFHVLGGLLGLQSLSLRDRLRLMNVGKQLLLNSRVSVERLDSMTVDEWLRKLGQSEESKKYLWDVIAVGSLNDDPSKVSALMFYRVLKTAFFGRRENASILIPNVGLSEYLVDPAETFLKSHDANVETGVGVERINREGDWVLSVECSDGRTRSAKVFILCVPHYDFLRIADNLDGESASMYEVVSRFESSPIITINLWLDRAVFESEFAAVLDSDIQWVFNRTRILKISHPAGSWQQFLSVVISGAAHYVNLEKDELVEIAMKDLPRILPRTQGAEVVHSVVIKEKRATFSPNPGINRCRPGTRTPLRNLFLAGDWTDTGYPATIEGAVMSGRNAAGEALAFRDNLQPTA